VIRDMRLQAFAALKASGMPSDAVSGGKRKPASCLDDYYHRNFGISEAERVLRACKLSDVFTLARLVYPCSEDDRHTRAENLCDSLTGHVPHAAEIEARGAGFWAGFGKTGPTGRAARERENLVRDIGALGVATALSAEAALAARVCGYEGQEEDFGARLRRQFFTGDVAGLASTVKRFNERVRTVANTVAFQTVRAGAGRSGKLSHGTWWRGGYRRGCAGVQRPRTQRDWDALKKGKSGIRHVDRF